MALHFNTERQPRSEALHLSDLDCSNHPVPNTPHSTAGHASFKHHGGSRKSWYSNITVLQGYNHNVNGLEENLKIECLCQVFYEEHIDFGCNQETWLSADYQCQIKTKHDGKIVSCLIFHHWQPIQEGWGSGGVAILLGKGGQEAWKN
eukprot:3632939-Ditylum_brightwellii.AAC.1